MALRPPKPPRLLLRGVGRQRNQVSRRWLCDHAVKKMSSKLETVQAHRLAQLAPSEIGVSHVQTALELFRDLEKFMLTKDRLSAVAQQLTRVLLTYQGWQLPVALRDDLPGGPALWHFGIPVPGGTPGAQLLPLASDDACFNVLSTGRSGVAKSIVSGAEAVAEYLPSTGHSRCEGLAFDAGGDRELMLGKDHLPMLRMWQSTLRLEALLSSEAYSSTAMPPATEEIASLLSEKVNLYLIRMGHMGGNTDLAHDSGGRNVIVLTSNDAAALSASAYGRAQVRSVSAEELLGMAMTAADSSGFAFTLGSDASPSPVGPGGKTHIPKWRTCAVSADWLASALKLMRVQPKSN